MTASAYDIAHEATDDERRANLKKATLAREAHASIKRQVASGALTVADVLNSEDRTWRSMRVIDLIKAVPGWGKAKAPKLMKEIGIQQNRRINGLGCHQRQALIDRLDNIE